MTLDHLEARAWADNHHAFGHFVATTIRSVREAFEVLAAVQYDAPWKRRAR